MLGDIILAEPHALIGFAGPRVIEQTIGQKLPKGFQRAEFLVEHGFVDRILPREEAKEVLSEILRMHGKRAEGMASGGGDLMKNSVPEENGKELQKEETAAESVKALAEETENTETSRDGQEKSLRGEKEETEWENLRKSSAWDCVQKARKKDSECQKYYVFSCIQQLLYFFCTAPVIFLQFFGILCHRHWNSNELFFCQFRHCLNSNLVGNALFRFLSWYCNRIIFPDQTDGL